MAQLLAAAAIVALIAYFAFFSHTSNTPTANSSTPAPTTYSSEVEQARQASQGGTIEMKKAKEAEQIMLKSAETKQDNIDYQSGMAPSP